MRRSQRANVWRMVGLSLFVAWSARGATPATGPLRVNRENSRYFTDGARMPEGSMQALCDRQQFKAPFADDAVLYLKRVKTPQEDRPAPIRLHPANPHYFEFRGQPTILVTSAEHYGAVINRDFDWQQYLETLAQDGMNYTRVFVGSYLEGEHDIDWMKYNNTLAPRPGKAGGPIRKQLKILRDFVSRLNFIDMKPAQEIVTSPLPPEVFARVLVQPGKVYWLYVHHSKHKTYGSFITGYEARKDAHRDSLELEIPAGTYRIQWIRPCDGKLLREDSPTHDGKKLRLLAPEYEDADVTAVIRRD